MTDALPDQVPGLVPVLVPVLVVARHAEAASPPGVADVDRPLTESGRADARAVGRWLRDAVGRPDLVVASPARRVAETIEGLLQAYDDRPPVQREPGVYAAGLDDLLAVLRGLDDAARTVLLVGHNPASSELVHALTGADLALRTAGVAVVRLRSAWADVAGDGSAELGAAQTCRAGAPS